MKFHSSSKPCSPTFLTIRASGPSGSGAMDAAPSAFPWLLTYSLKKSVLAFECEKPNFCFWPSFLVNSTSHTLAPNQSVVGTGSAFAFAVTRARVFLPRNKVWILTAPSSSFFCQYAFPSGVSSLTLKSTFPLAALAAAEGAASLEAAAATAVAPSAAPPTAAAAATGSGFAMGAAADSVTAALGLRPYALGYPFVVENGEIGDAGSAAAAGAPGEGGKCVACNSEKKVVGQGATFTL
mmetsp:Transcript_56528/g.101326  ORF Transcript_56528/g.101326 Transcript_56528/m.101326 type:complete len:238 (+) Transcript_56528:755-1468(+)